MLWESRNVVTDWTSITQGNRMHAKWWTSWRLVCPASEINCFFSPPCKHDCEIWYRMKTSQELVSHDIHNNKFQYKHTFSVEVVPISKVGQHRVCTPWLFVPKQFIKCPIFNGLNCQTGWSRADISPRVHCNIQSYVSTHRMLMEAYS